MINVAAMMLHVRQKHRVVGYEDLFQRLHRKLGDELQVVFLPALSFLFLLGKVEYHEKSDSFEFIEHGAAAP